MSFLQIVQILIIIALIYGIVNLDEIKTYAKNYTSIFNSSCNKKATNKKQRRTEIEIETEIDTDEFELELELELENFLNSQLENIKE